MSRSRSVSTTSSMSSFNVSESISMAAGELNFLCRLGFHQAKTVTTGIMSLVWKGSARPTWPAHLHMTLHWLRTQLDFPHHTITRARAACEAAAPVAPTPPGVKITPQTFHIARSELLKFEAEALRFRKGFAHPIPPEIDELVEEEKNDTSGWGNWWSGSSNQSQDGKSTGRGKSQKVILYLHGGAYVIGNPQVYRLLTSRIAMETGCRVFIPHYRLAPEAPFPAALHDALAAYLYLLNPHHPTFACTRTGHRHPHIHEAIAPTEIILMGDSAGGGLCMSLLNYLKDYLSWPNGVPMIPLPSSAILFSPWVDLTFQGQSWRTNADFDWLPAKTANLHEPMLPPSDITTGLDHPVHMYLFGANTKRDMPLPVRRMSIANSISWAETLLLSAVDREKARIRDVTERMVRHPLVSPVFSADMTGLPPILIQAGDAEMLRDETIALAHRYVSSAKSSSASDDFEIEDVDDAGVRRVDPKTGRQGYVRHELYKDMIHVFVAMAWLPMAKLAMDNVKRFVGEVERGVFGKVRDGAGIYDGLSKEEKDMFEVDVHLKL
ncbi:hypothetical protein HDU76_002901 [Blyttiomyces sp. JEL0837]|nr:hypothetical protein HDU76_002901 [Blyttiomyces sp. JEL0837]